MKKTKCIVKYIALSLLPLSCLQAEEAAPKKHSPQAWVEGDYLYWWIKNSPAPITVVTEGPTASDQTRVLGGKNVNTGARSGGWFGAGYFFDPDRNFEITGDYLFLSSGSKTKNVYSSGLPGSSFLNIPYFDPTLPGETYTPLAQPTTIGSFPPFSGNGTLKVSNSMQSAELKAAYAVLNDCHGFSLQALGGFLWWNFNERLTFNTTSPYISIPQEVFKTKDLFQTHNNFYGGQIGFGGKYLWKSLSLLLEGQVALGGMKSTLNTQGQFVTNDFTGFTSTQSFGSGYFAQSTNNGHFDTTNFSVIPQVYTQLGVRITKWLHLNLGYTFLYATQVMWASNQLDDEINPTGSPAIEDAIPAIFEGPSYPKPLLKTAAFWAQGMNVGLDFIF